MKRKEQVRDFHRRSFISNSVKLVLLGAIISPLELSCKNNKNKVTGQNGQDTTNKKKGGNHLSKKKPRQKWSHESLVVNSKTHVMHLPSSKIYHYYDEIKTNHLKDIAISAWASTLQEPVRFNKDQSGNIIEILTLQELKAGMNDNNFIMAIDTLSEAFRADYERANSKNFRLHELMLQLVALNNSIPADQKWMTFNAKIKRPEQLRKRQAWMASEAAFNERIKYISERQNDYKTRLSQRANRYSFT